MCVDTHTPIMTECPHYFDMLKYISPNLLMFTQRHQTLKIQGHNCPAKVQKSAKSTVCHEVTRAIL